MVSKKRDSIKTQLLADKRTKKILVTSSCNGRRHDFRQFKEMRLPIHPTKQIIADTGYQDLQKLHANTLIPFRRRKYKLLTKEQKNRRTEEQKNRRTKARK